MKISAVIMASGASKRMGENKLLFQYSGMSFIENTINKVLNSGFYEINLVTSYDEIVDICVGVLRADEMRYEKCNDFIITRNNNPSEGISKSIRLGVKNLKDCDAYMFFTSDQPKLSVHTIKKLMNEAEKNQIIIPKYNHENGSPAVFGADFRKELLNIDGDLGGRQLIQNNIEKVKYLEIKNWEEGMDIDTQEEYRKLIEC